MSKTEAYYHIRIKTKDGTVKFNRIVEDQFKGREAKDKYFDKQAGDTITIKVLPLVEPVYSAPRSVR